MGVFSERLFVQLPTEVSRLQLVLGSLPGQSDRSPRIPRARMKDPGGEQRRERCLVSLTPGSSNSAYSRQQLLCTHSAPQHPLDATGKARTQRRFKIQL
ncbi:Uncharacterized protein HZ326_17937 [Fusarium oxysporum f. sp. albedinis]|nr:Uncharacterized protein HZ326_17937 [Fusarium oxysporum f. sp. albedinis]